MFTNGTQKKKYQDKYDINLRNVIVYVYVTL